MALNKKDMKQASSTELLEASNYLGRVVQLIDVGLQKRKAYEGTEKKPAYQFWITYEVANEFMKDEDGKDILDKPRWISEMINIFSRSQDQAKSTKRINAFDPSNEWGDDWSKIVGEPCTITVVHSKCGKYANVGAISPPMKGMIVPDLVNPTKVFDTDEPDLEVFEALPEFLQKIITSNEEFQGSVLEKALAGGGEEAEEKDKSDDAPY